MALELDRRSREWARASAIVLAGATLLALVMVAHHPVVAAHGADDIMASIVRVRGMEHLVHGGLIVIMSLFGVGFCGFAAYLGLRRPLVQGGLVFYCIGLVLVIGAAVIDGFVTGDVAQRYVGAGGDEMRIGVALIMLCAAAIQMFSKAGLVLMSTGVFCWGAVLIQGRAAVRLAGVIGIAAGIAPAGLILATTLVLQPANLLAVMGVEAAWNLAVAVLLWRFSGQLADGADVDLHAERAAIHV